jgi:hypothetical protein
MGSAALFVEHSADRSNWLDPAPQIRLPMAGPYLEALFRKAFEVGLHDPSSRPDAAEWERALYRTFNILHPSPDGKNWFILTPGMPMYCPFSARKLTQPVPFASIYSSTKPGEYNFTRHCLTIYQNKTLHSWDLYSRTQPGEGADTAPKGVFQFKNGVWYLRNQSGETMTVIEGAEVPDGQEVEIRRQMMLLVSHGPNSHLFVFDFIMP